MGISVGPHPNEDLPDDAEELPVARLVGRQREGLRRDTGTGVVRQGALGLPVRSLDVRTQSLMTTTLLALRHTGEQSTQAAHLEAVAQHPPADHVCELSALLLARRDADNDTAAQEGTRGAVSVRHCEEEHAGADVGAECLRVRLRQKLHHGLPLAKGVSRDLPSASHGLEEASVVFGEVADDPLLDHLVRRLSCVFCGGNNMGIRAPPRAPAAAAGSDSEQEQLAR